AGLRHKESIVTEAAGNITGGAPHFTLRAHAANLLSASRLVLAAIWAIAFAHGCRTPAFLGTIAILGAVSDLLDGNLARRMRIEGSFGRWFDSAADIVFILTALLCEASIGALPFYIPILIAASFSQYAIDSMLLSGNPIRSRLGHF